MLGTTSTSTLHVIDHVAKENKENMREETDITLAVLIHVLPLASFCSAYSSFSKKRERLV